MQVRGPERAYGPLALASRSPRRAALLEAAGIPFTVGPFPDVDETWPPSGPGPFTDGTPSHGVQRLAVQKARAALMLARERVVLAADTLVFLGGEPLGKPGNDDEARSMLRRLSGVAHEVWTGVALMFLPAASLSEEVRTKEPKAYVRGVCTRLTFDSLTEARIDAYVASGEPMGKAGAYALQGEARSFVVAQDGPSDNVIGLPVDAVRSLLKQAGLEIAP